MARSKSQRVGRGASLPPEGAQNLGRLLLGHAQATEQLKVLLLLRGQRETCLSPEFASTVLSLPVAEVVDALEALCDRELAFAGLHDGGVGYAYHLQQPDIEKALDDICLEGDRTARGAIGAANPNAVERLRAAIGRRAFGPRVSTRS